MGERGRARKRERTREKHEKENVFALHVCFSVPACNLLLAKSDTADIDTTRDRSTLRKEGLLKICFLMNA